MQSLRMNQCQLASNTSGTKLLLYIYMCVCVCTYIHMYIFIYYLHFMDLLG
jgi:hypothetical protein